MVWAEDRRQKRHIFIMLLVVLAVINHGIRLSSRHRPATPGLTAPFSNAGGNAALSLNDVRLRIGRSLQRGARFCPGPTEQVCAPVLAAVRAVLGFGE